MGAYRLVIVEDEFFVANHLNDMLVQRGFEVAGIYHSGEDFLAETLWDFDAAILDIFLEGKLTGLDLAKQLKVRDKPYVFLTANQESETLKQAVNLTPAAYLSKPFQENDLSAALTLLSLRNDKPNVDPFFIYLKPNEHTNEPLTLREIEILKALIEGLTNPQIEELHFISQNTIKTHSRKVYKKFNVENRIELKEKFKLILEA